MDGQRLDQLARAIGKRGTRRQALRAGIASVAGLTAIRHYEASATLIPCQITCPPVVQNNDPSLCGALVTFQILPNAGSTCTEIVCDQTSGTLFPVGATSVHCNDINGRADCDFTITVEDAELPAITCPPNIDVTGSGPAIVEFAAVASDNCAGLTASCNPPSGSAFDVGMTVVTCTAADASNNENSCQFNVTVIPDATSTPTETPTTEATSTPTETPVEGASPTATSSANPTIDPATGTPAATEAPATVAPTSAPVAPTVTTEPVNQLPSTGAGGGDDGGSTLMPLIAAGGGAALLAKFGLRTRAKPLPATIESSDRDA